MIGPRSVVRRRPWAAAAALASALAWPGPAAAGLRLEEALARAGANAADLGAEAVAAAPTGRGLPPDGLEMRAQQGGLGRADQADRRVALRLRWRGLAVAAAEGARAAAEAERLGAEAAAAQAQRAWEVERAFAMVLLLEAEQAQRARAAAAWAEVASGMERRAALGQEAALDVADARVRAAEAGLRAGRLRAELEAQRAWLSAAVGAPVDAGGLEGPAPRPRPAPAELGQARPAEAAADARLARAEALPRLEFVQGGVRADPVVGERSGEISMAVRIPVLDGSQRGRASAASRAAGAAARAQAEAADGAARAAAEAQGIAAGGAALVEERAVIDALRATLPPEAPAEPLATRALRARVAELEAELLAAERRLWP